MSWVLELYDDTFTPGHFQWGISALDPALWARDSISDPPVKAKEAKTFEELVDHLKHIKMPHAPNGNVIFAYRLRDTETDDIVMWDIL